ncbi:hypothetical protein [Paenibacillus polymyxa]|uniref:hypothetical protein n=1 Tax=Paenibacillus polymyxa TaxID=1406 RepID=UPI002AB522B7|nr:hypothetical protein [Paenibacillus polymyxa]MDY8021584.1 hypothetical protein [Paenibacillus polymyxa]
MEEDNRGKQLEEAIIENYKQEEDMMILVFAQWCINHGLEPEELYREAYPHQDSNERLLRVRKLTVPREEAGDIPLDTVLGVLSMFGNEDLAMVVSEAAAKLPSERK